MRGPRSPKGISVEGKKVVEEEEEEEEEEEAVVQSFAALFSTLERGTL